MKAERRGPESGEELVVCSALQVRRRTWPRRLSQRGALRFLYREREVRGVVLEVKRRHQVR